MILETILWLSLTIYHEARGEEKLAQIAVAHVTLNRAKKSSVKKVVLKPYAFSWTQKENYFPYDIKSLWESAHSAYVAIQGYDFTGGADHYHHVKVKPYWRHKMSFVGSYGSHLFYKPMVFLKKEKEKIIYGIKR